MLELTGHVGQGCQTVGVEILVSHLEHVVLDGPDHHQDQHPAQGELADGPLCVPGDLLGPQQTAVDRLIEELLLTGDEEYDERHVDMVVVGLLGVDGAGVESLQYRDHELLRVAAGKNEVPELVVPVQQEVEQEGGVLGVERVGQGGVEGRVLQSEGGARVQDLL